jgi:hypothetical protein
VEAYGDKQVWHQSLILLPALTVLGPASLNIPIRAVDNHTGEEYGIEPWKWAIKPGDQTPSISKEEIAGIVNLSRIAIPSVSENRIPSLGLDDARVFNSLPRELREGLPFNQQATFLDSEAVLLRVGGVPDPIYEKVGNEECRHKIWVPAVCGRRVVGKVECAMAVAQGYASQIPEDQHEAPFLIVHVPRKLDRGDDSHKGNLPCSGDTLLALGACICIQEVSHNQECNLSRDVTIILVLASSGST